MPGTRATHQQPDPPQLSPPRWRGRTTPVIAPGGPRGAEPIPEAQQEAPAAPAELEQQNQNDLPQWARDAITKANKEAANYRTQVAELKPRADQFASLEEASKSEAQRLQEAAQSAQSDAEQARAEAVRYKAAATHGISVDHFDLLGSGTEEEVSARAEKIAALISAQIPPAAAPKARPVEQLRPGASPGEPETEDDVLYAQIYGTTP